MSSAVRPTENVRRSIPTRYEGRLYRSKLEADYARAFDVLKLSSDYEREGRYFGEMFYLPDFFLTKSRQWFEVKGILTEPDVAKKFQELVKVAPVRPYTDDETCPDIAIVAGLPNGYFFGYPRTAHPITDWLEFLHKGARFVELMKCGACQGWWFCDPEYSWRCQCCGAYDGNKHVDQVIASPLPDFPFLHTLKGII